MLTLVFTGMRFDHPPQGLDVVLSDPRHVLILDDTEQVWEHNEANLMQVGGATG